MVTQQLTKKRVVPSDTVVTTGLMLHVTDGKVPALRDHSVYQAATGDGLRRCSSQ